VPDPVKYLQKAFEQTLEATSKPNEWHGTTTACSALLHHTRKDQSSGSSSSAPVLYVTNLGDSQILVIRPSSGEIVYKTTEQWHWFDCPRQLGTNSPDTPNANAVCDKINVELDDIVLAMSDGVPDNLWDHEIVTSVLQSLKDYKDEGSGQDGGDDRLMTYVARKLMNDARVIAEDPFAESPFMERAVEEGLALEGGKTYSC
jgi:serine/threonine protein phosphatase PrpC